MGIVFVSGSDPDDPTCTVPGDALLSEDDPEAAGNPPELPWVGGIIFEVGNTPEDPICPDAGGALPDGPAETPAVPLELP